MQKHWNVYVDALGGNKPPADSNVYPTSDSTIGVSGFLDLKPKNPEIQAKYDAMSPTWGGIQPSESAAASNLFKASFMPMKNQTSK